MALQFLNQRSKSRLWPTLTTPDLSRNLSSQSLPSAALEPAHAATFLISTCKLKLCHEPANGVTAMAAACQEGNEDLVRLRTIPAPVKPRDMYQLRDSCML